ncbi:hypothetical protein DUNSADRAFT_13981 [Dunaliella salina]|uniref:SAP domain-containing protein n=1 Tax=Dunaliella salina TaxID=3046 RepID=A0ABQ7G8A1_DUNSA|nr:hypothetical protein DUNSADRAFT_13981 [Dunaliella salina]|eukprot:KAF5830833.1 hypothetical protein DUNSADRAFT_13981 [Dunaliella salina]
MSGPDEEKWVDSLKVNDLKEELKKRGQPTNGLKAQLAQRLKELLQAGAKEDTAGNGEQGKQQDPEPAAEPASAEPSAAQHGEESRQTAEEGHKPASGDGAPSPAPPSSGKPEHVVQAGKEQQEQQQQQAEEEPAKPASPPAQQHEPEQSEGPSNKEKHEASKPIDGQQEEQGKEKQKGNEKEEKQTAAPAQQQNVEALDYDQEEEQPATAMPEPEPQPQPAAQSGQAGQQEQSDLSGEPASTPGHRHSKKSEGQPPADQTASTDAEQQRRQQKTPASTDSAPAKRKRAPIPLYQPRDKQSPREPAGSQQQQEQHQDEGPPSSSAKRQSQQQQQQQPQQGDTKAAANPQHTDGGRASRAAAANGARPGCAAAAAAAAAAGRGSTKSRGAMELGADKKEASTAGGTQPGAGVLEEDAPLLDTCALLISNLVRPFTDGQFRELIQRTGSVEGMWMAKMKRALHGIKWPPGTNKLLAVSPLAEDVAKISIAEKKEPSEVAPASVQTPRSRAAQQQPQQQQQQPAPASTAGKKRKAEAEVDIVDVEGVPEPERRKVEAAKRQLEAAIREEQRQEAAAAAAAAAAADKKGASEAEAARRTKPETPKESGWASFAAAKAAMV